MSDEAKIVKADSWKCHFTKSRLAPNNEREDLGDIDWLVVNIQEEGVKESLSGYKGKDPETGEEVVFVENGSRRWYAMKRIYEETGVDTIFRVITFDPRYVNEAQRVVDRLLRNEGKPFTPLEKAKSIGKLIAHNWDEDMIAKKLGLSRQTVINMAMLNGAPEQIKALVASNAISATFAISRIREGLVDAFLEDYNGGKFDPKDDVKEPQTVLYTVGQEQNRKTPKRAAITAKTVQEGPNSLKELKKFRKAVDTSEEPVLMPEHKLKAYNFLLRILDNEVTENQIANFFKKD